MRKIDFLVTKRPHIGAGCQLAMEDSIQLVESLRSVASSENGNFIPLALKDFEKQRLPIVQYMVQQGKEIGDAIVLTSQV